MAPRKHVGKSIESVKQRTTRSPACSCISQRALAKRFTNSVTAWNEKLPLSSTKAVFVPHPAATLCESSSTAAFWNAWCPGFMNRNFSPGYRHQWFEETNCKISLSEKSTEIIRSLRRRVRWHRLDDPRITDELAVLVRAVGCNEAAKNFQSCARCLRLSSCAGREQG